MMNAVSELVTRVGLPAVVSLILLYLLKRQQDSATKLTEILSALTEHVFEAAERGSSNGSKLDRLEGMLNRGVCKIK